MYSKCIQGCMFPTQIPNTHRIEIALKHMICMHVYTCIHAYIHTYMHVNTCTYIYAHIYMHIYACTYMYVHICMYIYIYICRFIYIHIYICTYTHAHRLMLSHNDMCLVPVQETTSMHFEYICIMLHIYTYIYI